ncbi:MAG: hypothetical protein DME01_27390 [Candidatus Rokuibacteriota bacterium]|nr:MAG: hypothetical protein DME01_27390 [Candidatus Rokubacteria bacterium]
MTSLRALLAAGLCASLLAGCTYYEVAPGVYTTTPTSTFDRSWGAARNAMLEEGVRITQEERSTGTLRGDRNGIGVLALVRTQADGSVRVEFKTVGATSVDPQLIERISASYDRQMGR